jgi:hypothetical protein
MINLKNSILALSISSLLISTAWAKNGVESIYINGKIYTATDSQPLQQAIAISDKWYYS